MSAYGIQALPTFHLRTQRYMSILIRCDPSVNLIKSLRLLLVPLIRLMVAIIRNQLR